MSENRRRRVSGRSAGDATAFLEFFDAQAEPVRAYLERRVGRLDADDLLAEVWLRAFASRGSFRGDWPDGRPWLYGVARNTLRVHWREILRGRPASGPVAFDPWPEVDARLDAAHLGAPLRMALLELTEIDREVLLLVAWEQLTPTEVAIALDIPPGTARSRLHRARSIVRSRLPVDPDPEPERWTHGRA